MGKQSSRKMKIEYNPKTGEELNDFDDGTISSKTYHKLSIVQRRLNRHLESIKSLMDVERFGPGLTKNDIDYLNRLFKGIELQTYNEYIDEEKRRA